MSDDNSGGFTVFLFVIIIILLLGLAASHNVMQGYTVSNKKLIECGYAEYDKTTGRFHFIKPKKAVKDE